MSSQPTRGESLSVISYRINELKSDVQEVKETLYRLEEQLGKRHDALEGRVRATERRLDTGEGVSRVMWALFIPTVGGLIALFFFVIQHGI